VAADGGDLGADCADESRAAQRDAFAFLYAACENHKAGKRWMRSLVISCVLFGALVSPWLIRNEAVFGKPVFFRSNYWFEFYLGNYHFSNGVGFSGKHPNNNRRRSSSTRNWGNCASSNCTRRSIGFCAQVSAGISLVDRDADDVVLGRHAAALPDERVVAAVGILAAFSRRVAGLLFVLTRRPTRLANCSWLFC